MTHQCRAPEFCPGLGADNAVQKLREAHGQGCTNAHHCCLLDLAADEIERLQRQSQLGDYERLVSELRGRVAEARSKQQQDRRLLTNIAKLLQQPGEPDIIDGERILARIAELDHVEAAWSTALHGDAVACTVEELADATEVQRRAGIRKSERIAALERQVEDFEAQGIVLNDSERDELRNERDEARAELARLKGELSREEAAHLETMRQRDDYSEAADRLAYAIAPIEVIGEHSNLNNPWTNALEHQEYATSAGLRREVPTRERVADALASTRDEARIGGGTTLDQWLRVSDCAFELLAKPLFARIKAIESRISEIPTLKVSQLDDQSRESLEALTESLQAESFNEKDELGDVLNMLSSYAGPMVDHSEPDDLLRRLMAAEAIQDELTELLGTSDVVEEMRHQLETLSATLAERDDLRAKLKAAEAKLVKLRESIAMQLAWRDQELARMRKWLSGEHDEELLDVRGEAEHYRTWRSKHEKLEKKVGILSSDRKYLVKRVNEQQAALNQIASHFGMEPPYTPSEVATAAESKARCAEGE